eukprot:7390458-Prymnesium_polylepis.2
MSGDVRPPATTGGGQRCVSGGSLNGSRPVSLRGCWSIGATLPPVPHAAALSRGIVEREVPFCRWLLHPPLTMRIHALKPGCLCGRASGGGGMHAAGLLLIGGVIGR